MQNEQLSEGVAINEDNPLGYSFGVLPRLRGKRRSRYENASRRADPIKATRKRLNFRTANRVLRLIPFRLHIDDIETKGVLSDKAIDPAVSRPTYGFPCVSPGAAITHRDKKVDNQTLEKTWRQ